MSQKPPIKIHIVKPLPAKSSEGIPDKVQINEYKDLFAALFKIKDKEIHRRVLQAVNGQNLTCANCANKIQVNGSSSKKTPTTFSFATQTLDKDFDFLAKINNKPRHVATTISTTSRIAATTTSNSNSVSNINNVKKPNVENVKKTNVECHLLNKIQLGRARRKFEPYAIKIEKEKCIIPDNKVNYLRQNHGPDSLLVS